MLPSITKNKKREREINFIPYSEDNVASTSEREGSMTRQSDEEDHFQFKFLVEEARRKFGSGWLVHNVSPSFLPTSTSNDTIQVSTSPGSRKTGETVAKTNDLKLNLSENHTKVPESMKSPTVTSPGIYNVPVLSPVLTEESDSETEGDESELFFAHNYLNDIPLMLSLSSLHFVESDGMSGKQIYRWPLTSVQSAQLLQEGGKVCIDMKFDVLNRDNEERKYKMESLHSAKLLLNLLDPQLCQNSHENATDGALQCFKCQSEFSKSLVENFLQPRNKETAEGEVAQELKRIRKCPNCGSTVLLEMFQKPRSSSNVVCPNDVAVSVDRTRVIGSLEGSPTMRPRSVSLVHNDRLPLRTPGHHEENDSTSSSSIECILNTAEDNCDNLTARSQSDITVLTNPSQSSFTIISQSCSSASGSSFRESSQTYGKELPPYNSSRILSSPVDIGHRGLSQDSPWYDSSSTKTTLVHSPSPKTWDFTDLDESIVSISYRPTEPSPTKVDGQEDSQKIWQLLEQNEDTVQRNSRINHQVKLHMEVNIFQEEEEFVAGINGNIVLESNSQEVTGFLIVSTEYIYIFKEENNTVFEDTGFGGLEKHPLRSLHKVYTLLGSQGFALSFVLDTSATQKSVIVILKDADICNSFVISLESDLKHVFSRMSLTAVPRFKLLTEEILLNIQKEIFKASCDEESGPDERVDLFLLGSAQLSSDSKRSLDSVAFVVTSRCLYLASVIYFTKPHDPTLHFQLVQSQEIGNLTEVHLSEDMKQASFHFLDEDVGEEEFWIFLAQSKSSLASLLVMLKTPWEELFEIDLELSVNKECSCGL